MNVVTSAMMTNIAKSRAKNNSQIQPDVENNAVDLRPRVFMRIPSAAASRQRNPEKTRRPRRPADLPQRRDQDQEISTIQSRSELNTDCATHSRKGEKGRQKHDANNEPLSAARSVPPAPPPGHPRVTVPKNGAENRVI